MKKVYISYANEDLKYAQEISAMLLESNFSVLLVDHTVFNFTDDIADVMLQNIKSADTLLCIYSNNTNQSNFVSIELNAAVKRSVPVYIIKLGDVEIDKKNHFATANSLILKGSSLNERISDFKLIVGGGVING